MVWLGEVVGHWRVLLWTLGKGDKGQPCVYASVFLFARLYKLGGDWRGLKLILSTRTWLHSSVRQTLVLRAAVCPRGLLTRLFVLLCARKVGMGWHMEVE